MKKKLQQALLPLLFTVAVPQTMSADVLISKENFPDDNFRAFVASEFDRDPEDGKLSDSEIEQVTYMNCYNRGITSLEGIKFFTNLSTLECSNNPITTLDVSGMAQLYNIYMSDTGIETLIARNTPNLSYNSNWPVKTLDFSEKGVSNGIDISGPAEWDDANQWYVPSDNPLETIILNDCENIDWVSIYRLKNLKTINMSGCSNLTQVYIYENPALASIDLSKLPALQYVDFKESPALSAVTWGDKSAIYSLNISNTGFAPFDLKGFTSLQYLYMNDCTKWGGTLDVSGLTELNTIEMSNSGIETLTAQQTPSLSYNYNWPVKTVDFSQKGSSTVEFSGPFERDDASQGYVPLDNPLERLIMNNCAELEYIYIDRLKNLKSIDLSNNEKMYQVNIYENPVLSSIDLSMAPALQSVSLNDNPAVTSITWDDKTTVTSLNINNSSFAAFDLKGFTSLQQLYMNGCTNWGKTLDVSGLTQLNTIEMSNSGIETLIARQTTSLVYNYYWPVKTLDFSQKGGSGVDIFGPSEWDDASQGDVPQDNPLERLIMNNCAELEYVSIYRLKSLKSVSLSGNDKMYQINVNENPSLASIDLSKNPALQYVSVNDNPVLSTVTWGDKTTVTSLNINNCGLEPFDLKGFTSLGALYMNGCNNWGNTLDVSGLTELYSIEMKDTGIEALIARNTPRLDYNYDWPVKTLDFSQKGSSSLSFNGPYEWDETSEKYVPLDNPLEALILNNSEDLQWVSIYRLKSLKSIDLSGNVNMYQMSVNENPSLTSLDLKDNTALKYVSVYDNPILNDLDVRPLPVLEQLDCHNNALLWLDLSKNSSMSYWNYVEQPQHPQMDLVTLSADKVAYPVVKDFDATKVQSLTVGGQASSASKATVDGQDYFVLSADAPHAAGMVGKDVAYDYQTGFIYENSEQPLKVEGKVQSMAKGATRIYLTATTANGTYGNPAITVPVATTSEFYDGKLSYASDNTAVVTVDAETGALTIVGAGTATITVSGNETDYRLAPEDVTYTVAIAKASPVLAFEKSEMEATVLDDVPANALTKGVYDGKVIYTSSNPDVATVDENGKVTTKAGGTVTITASGEETANCNKPTPASYTLTVKKINTEITCDTETLVFQYSKTQRFIIEALVTTGYDGKLTYKSDNENVLKSIDDENSGAFCFMGAGEANIIISAPETGLYYAAVDKVVPVRVEKAQPEFQFAEASQSIFSDEPYGLILLKSGEAFVSNHSANALSIGDYDGDVVFTSSDPNIAEVDATLSVKIKKAGILTITATGAETANFFGSQASFELKILERCDVNGDGSVDVADISTIIDAMAGNISTEGCDVNNDNSVDVADIATVISRMAELARMLRIIEE